MRIGNLITEFLTQKRFAMVGVSRNPRDFSRRLMREFLRRGYDVIPVNPKANEVEGNRCFASIRDIRPPVTTALLMTSRAATEQVLRECADAGVTLVWIYGISGAKDISPAALRVCEDYGIGVVPGYCPYMFMPVTAFFHRLHGFALKLTGNYPR